MPSSWQCQWMPDISRLPRRLQLLRWLPFHIAICVGDESCCLEFSLSENEAPRGDDRHRSMHAEAMEATAPTPTSDRAETGKLLSIPPVA